MVRSECKGLDEFRNEETRDGWKDVVAIEVRSFNLKSKTVLAMSNIQNRKLVGVSLIAFTLVFGGVIGSAQQPKKVPLIGYLSSNVPDSS